MSPIYDNWGKLVAAVVKKEQLWQLCHQQSPSPSLSSESESESSFSFNLGSIDDVDFSGPIFGDFASVSKDESFVSQVDVAGSSSSVLVKDQLPDAPAPVKLLVPQLENSLPGRSRRRSLVIEVPKLVIQSWDAFEKCQVGSRASLTPSPGTVSPVGPLPTSRTRSGTATQIHQGAARRQEPRNDWPNDTIQRCHPLPLPPQTVSSMMPSLPRTPGRSKNPVSPGSPWKKGKLIDGGTNGCVYIGFNSETGAMCAMEEVILSSDDAESKKTGKKLEQEITLFSSLRHPNIVQYYGSEVLDEKFYIYSEYISGGTVSKILREHGRLGDLAIRSYTKQILCGLAYLHSKSIVHGDIRGDTILVDPNGSVKLARLGTAKHIIGDFSDCCPAVDIWLVGCTVLEMATARPPWSQYKAALAMFKIGCTNELPIVPDYLSGEGKEFVRLCLQPNPVFRPTVAQLLKHPFVKGSSSPIEKQKAGSTSSFPPGFAATSTVNLLGINHARNLQHLDSERPAIHSSRVLSRPNIMDIYSARNISSTMSPVAVVAQTARNISSTMPPVAVVAQTPSSRRVVSPAVPVPILHPPRNPQHLNGRTESPRLHWYEM